ncbi:Uncharacterised protein [Mycoplasmopsis maculosa]|uniref:Uncharacterized protein n=1 Tax=Mycoplasmopsis maculosa TaxID=114885 RepID=A0A449B3Q2_9BACT|nr:Uncharacterised protein [Mycoplasmopsis maculosa]
MNYIKIDYKIRNIIDIYLNKKVEKSHAKRKKVFLTCIYKLKW